MMYSKGGKPVVVIPVFPGANGEYELEDGFIKAGAAVKALVFRNRTPKQREESVNELTNAINTADILAIPSGMNAMFITSALKREPVRAAIEALIARKGLVLGMGEGFNALVKTGLLPYGKFADEVEIAVERNITNKYICRMVDVRVASVKSPWLNGCNVGDVFTVPYSAQEGRVVISSEMFEELSANGQIASQYIDDNPCGADFAVESMTSPDGRIMGRMCSYERLGDDLYQNIPNIKEDNFLKNAVDYFREGNKPVVAVLMGSDSDWAVVKPAVDTLKKFGIGFEVRVMSAHRTPDVVAEFVRGLHDRGFKAIIAAAGKAAHLAGVVAAYTVLPVIALPVSSKTLDGLDALLAMVQMPPGIPVAAVAIDGAQNAALLAISIIGAGDENIYAELLKFRREMAESVMAKDAALNEKIKADV